MNSSLRDLVRVDSASCDGFLPQGTKATPFFFLALQARATSDRSRQLRRQNSAIQTLYTGTKATPSYRDAVRRVIEGIFSKKSVPPKVSTFSKKRFTENSLISRFQSVQMISTSSLRSQLDLHQARSMRMKGQ